MWDFGTAAAAIVALLVPAAPGQPPPVLPPSEPTPGCIVPIDGMLDLCPRDDLRPPVLCFVPVSGNMADPPGALEPDCPDPVPDARGRIVPVTPPTP